MMHMVNEGIKEMVLGAYQRTVLGEMIEYTLYAERSEARVGFRIVICRGKEKAEADFGEDVFRVVDFFSKIVQGNVLPYTLHELVEDFSKNEEICG